MTPESAKFKTGVNHLMDDSTTLMCASSAACRKVDRAWSQGPTSAICGLVSVCSTPQHVRKTLLGMLTVFKVQATLPFKILPALKTSLVKAVTFPIRAHNVSETNMGSVKQSDLMPKVMYIAATRQQPASADLQCAVVRCYGVATVIMNESYSTDSAFVLVQQPLQLLCCTKQAASSSQMFEGCCLVGMQKARHTADCCCCA